MIPAEAVEAAAKAAYGLGPVQLFGRDNPVTWEQLSESILGRAHKEDELAKARAALEAAAPYMLSHEREQTRLAHLDAMVNRDTASRLEQAIAGVLELAAPQRHMVSAAEIREWIANALEGEK